MTDQGTSKEWAAEKVRDAKLVEYEHGGGRLYLERKGELRELIADFYNADTRDYIMGLLRGAAHEPCASSACPICGVESPHSHDPVDICKWLEAQASRFGLTVEIFDKRAHEKHVEYLQSDRGQFEQFMQRTDMVRAVSPQVGLAHHGDDGYVAPSMHLAWKIWCGGRSTQPPGEAHALITDLLVALEVKADSWRLIDHGCQECVPGQDVGAVQGFRCVRHRARSFIERSASTKGEGPGQ